VVSKEEVLRGVRITSEWPPWVLSATCFNCWCANNYGVEMRSPQSIITRRTRYEAVRIWLNHPPVPNHGDNAVANYAGRPSALGSILGSFYDSGQRQPGDNRSERYDTYTGFAALPIYLVSCPPRTNARLPRRTRQRYRRTAKLAGSELGGEQPAGRDLKRPCPAALGPSCSATRTRRDF
jgi:hypothetical protein